MDLTADQLPFWLLALGWAGFGSLVAWQAWGSPWSLLKDNGLIPLFNLTILLLAGLWWLNAGVYEGLNFHLIGLTTVVLIFGWRLALMAGTFALLLLSVLGLREFSAMGINGLYSVALPVWLAQVLHSLIYHRMPRHLFVYVLVSAHFASMAVIAAVALAGSLTLLALGVHPWERVWGEYLIFLPLLMLPEGFVNGTIMTMLSVLRPQWVRSFDDRDYIDGK
ncbi:MAG: energy-coupling factor ABC transporter permease [Pseudomonadota bacterium]